MLAGKSIAILQPYVFPYIGYFQLVGAVDQFVFLDDVNFIKKGWINRNFIFSRQGPLLFTIPLKNASQNQTILESAVFQDGIWSKKLLKQLEQNYSKAPYFKDVFNLVEAVLSQRPISIAEMAIDSIKAVMAYLALPMNSMRSSQRFSNDLRGEARIIDICQSLEAGSYINPIGGIELYANRKFAEVGIELRFLKSRASTYLQFGSSSQQPYSMIDVLMFNSPSEVRAMMVEFELVSNEISS